MSIVLQSSGGGSVTVQEPTTASNFIATLPAATGDVMVSGNMPAFSAYPNTAQNINNATFTKVAVSAENFDTNNCYDSTTNYRFTPTVAGYYQVSASISLQAASTGIFNCIIYKNASSILGGQVPFYNSVFITSAVNGLVYMNGTSDYIEVYVYQTSGGTCAILTGRPDLNNFSSALVRSA
jgi:hypothetical protein